MWWLQLPSIDLASEGFSGLELLRLLLHLRLISFHLNLEWKQRSLQSAVLRTASQPDRFPISSRLAGEMREAAEKEERLYRPPSDTFALQLAIQL